METPPHVEVSGTRDGKAWTVVALYDSARATYTLSPASGSEFVATLPDWVPEWATGTEPRGMVATLLEQTLLGEQRSAILVGYQF